MAMSARPLHVETLLRGYRQGRLSPEHLASWRRATRRAVGEQAPRAAKDSSPHRSFHEPGGTNVSARVAVEYLFGTTW